MDHYGYGSASFSSTINESPCNGTLTVSPTQGYALTTKFTLSAPGWQDKDLPLFYQFVYYYNNFADTGAFEDNANPLTGPIFANSLVTILPAAINNNLLLYVQVLVSDYLGGMANASTTLQTKYNSIINKTDLFRILANNSEANLDKKIQIIDFVARDTLKEHLSVTTSNTCSCTSRDTCNQKKKCDQGF